MFLGYPVDTENGQEIAGLEIDGHTNEG